MMKWLKQKVVSPIIGLLKQGISPVKIAEALVVGLLISYFPVYGSHTLLCALLIWVLKLNPVAVYTANYVAFPVFFVLYVPMIRGGEWLFGADTVNLNPVILFEMIQESIPNTVVQLWNSTWYAVGFWLLISLPMYFIIRKLFVLILVRQQKKLM